MNKLTTAVWEITMGCNMRCKHCGSSCAEALPDELNTSEALEVCDQLKDLGVNSWQLQIALPMGNFAKRPEWLIEPQDILSIIDFAYNKIGGKLLIVLADCIGYYSNKDIKVNENFLNDNWSWTGCGAGKHVIGILHNGDIVACTSIRDKTLVAGNIREKSLKSIWESPDSFKWNRNFDSSKLKGFCRECRYTERCLGGCSNSRYCINGSFESENRYCAYNVEMKKWKKYLESLNDISEIDNIIEKAAALKHQDLYKIACEIKQSKL